MARHRPCHVFIYVACLLLATCLLPGNSHAFKRSQTDDNKLLFWANHPIPFTVHEEGSPGLDAASTLSAIRESFKSWTLPSCTCLKFQDNGNTKDRTLGFDQDNPNENINIVLFQTQSWSHSPQAVAVTSTVFRRTDGQIVAFDMELNQVDFQFSLTGEKRKMDIQNTVTHEVGHVIGLDHSTNTDAAMFAAGQPGETKKRTLHKDDIDGLCTLYPKTDSGTCNVINPNPPDGCGCTTFPSTSHIPASLLLLLFALVWWRMQKSPTK